MYRSMFTPHNLPATARVTSALYLCLSLLVSTGCGTTGAGVTTSKLASTSAEVVPDGTIDKIQRYRLSGDSSSPALFATSLTACDIPESRPLRATTRQLLVGFDSLEFGESSELTALSATRTIATASVGGQPVTLAVYSTRQGQCVQDFIGWFNADAPPAALTALEALLEAQLSAVPGVSEPCLSEDCPGISLRVRSSQETVPAKPATVATNEPSLLSYSIDSDLSTASAS